MEKEENEAWFFSIKERSVKSELFAAMMKESLVLSISTLCCQLLFHICGMVTCPFFEYANF